MAQVETKNRATSSEETRERVRARIEGIGTLAATVRQGTRQPRY